MGKQSRSQITTRLAQSALVDKPLREAAEIMYQSEYERAQSALMNAVVKMCGRTPTPTDPYRGWSPQVELDGFTFRLITKRENTQLCVFLPCDKCDADDLFYPADSLAALGKCLANYEIDPTCWECVKKEVADSRG